MLIKSCCLLLFIFSECLTTKITRLEVPTELRLGSPEAADVLLDCQYELESDEGLVVYWYFNKALVYQWIKGGKDRGTSAGGILKDYLDLTYNVSVLPTQQYRAMRILNPIQELSGNYTCKVSTDYSEDVAHKHMQFYDPGEDPTLSYTVSDGNQTEEDVVTLECAVSGVFPQPELIISVDGQVVNRTQASVNTTKGRYNTSALAVVPAAELPTDTEVQCDLILPFTTYNRTIALTYTEVEVTSEGPAAAESAPAAVGATESHSAAGSVGSLQASLSLLLVGLAASFRDLAQLRRLRRA